MKKFKRLAGFLLFFMLVMAVFTACVSVDDDSYTVSFDGQGASNPADMSIIDGQVIDNLPTVERAGYIFGGWFTAISGGGSAFTNGTLVTSDITVYAYWELIVYQVYYDSQNADILASPTNSDVAEGGTVSSLPIPPIRTNYSFAGWFTAVNGGGVEFFDSTLVTSTFTVYAKWIDIYTVLFDGQGATTAASFTNKSVISNESVVALPVPPTKTGCLFDGWFTNAAGDGVEFIATTPVTSDITVYAKWLNLYTVTYDANGSTSGSVPTDGTSYTNGQAVPVLDNSGHLLNINVPIDSYRFAGWTNSGGDVYTNTSVFSMGASNVSLYANWVSYSNGDVGPAGGWVFYDAGDYTTYGWRYLEASTYDNGEWGINFWSFSSIDVGTQPAIGNGQSNTTLIINATNEDGSAALYCDNLSITHNLVEYNDWFLPSLNELQLMYTNVFLFNLDQFTSQNIDDAYYWSSTEYSSTEASVVLFYTNLDGSGGGGTDYKAKDTSASIISTRPIRSF